MYNPPHPGEFITDIYLEPNGISGRELATKLDVAASTLSRILKGTSRITPEMALRLSKAIGRSPESWLAMQDNHDLWIARRHVNLQRVGKLNLAAAQVATLGDGAALVHRAGGKGKFCKVHADGYSVHGRLRLRSHQ